MLEFSLCLCNMLTLIKDYPHIIYFDGQTNSALLQWVIFFKDKYI